MSSHRSENETKIMQLEEVCTLQIHVVVFNLEEVYRLENYYVTKWKKKNGRCYL